MTDIHNNGSANGQAPVQPGYALPPPPPTLVPFNQIDWNAAFKHQSLLDPTATLFLFEASDDNKDRRKRRNDYLKPFAKELKTASRTRKNAIYGGAPGFANQQRLGSIADPHTRQWIEERQAQGCGIFITLQEMKGDKRRILETTRIRAVFGDMDGGQTKPWPFPPSFTVETSEGKEQAYWLVAGHVPVTDETRDLFTGIEQRIIDDHGADNGAKDLARVLRLAGTWHLKGTPRQVRIKAPQGQVPSYSWATYSTPFRPS